MPKLLIFTAMDLEMRAILHAMKAAAPGRARSFMPGGSNPPIELRSIGIGATHMGIFPGDKPIAVIMAGVAGALAPQLRIADIVLDAPADFAAPARFARGSIHTASELIATPAQKSRLFRETAAWAVDMENAIVRRAAQAAGIPFIGIRAISDTADDSIDPSVMSLVNDFGRPRLAAIAALLLKRPTLVPQLSKLGQRTRRATEALGNAVVAFLEMNEEKVEGER